MKTLTRDLLDEITRRLVEELHPEQIILFGSHAWGTPDEDSDIDLLVIVPDGTPATSELALRARGALRGIGIPKDILVRSRSQIERLRPVYASLESEILERGRILYG
jgi:predicted nucleotidyltransferase